MTKQDLIQQSAIRTISAVTLSTLGLGMLAWAGYLVVQSQGAITCRPSVYDETTSVVADSKLTFDRSGAFQKGIFALTARQKFQKSAEDRKTRLRGLMRTDVQAANEMLLADASRDKVAGQTKNCVEQPARIAGRLEVQIMDQEHTATTSYFLHDGKKSYPVFGVPIDTKPGSVIEVTGVTVEGDLLARLAPAEEGIGAPMVKTITAAPSATLSDQHRPLLVLMGDYTNTNVRFPDYSMLESITTNLNAYYQENSYGNLQWDVTNRDWVETSLTRTTACDVLGMLNALVQAHDATIDYRQYEGGDIVIMAPFPDNCRWGGMSQVVPQSISTSEGIVHLTPAYVKVPTPTQANIEYVINHELGHNLSGSSHANWARCPNGQLFLDANCTKVEYEDPYDVMGGWYNPTASEFRVGHYTAERKSWLGWITPNQIVTINNAGAEQTVDLKPVEWSGPGIKLLRIQRSSTEYITVEFRQPTQADGTTVNFDGQMFNSRFPEVFQGAVVRQSNGWGTYLYDTTPTPTNDPADTTIAVGQSITDPLGGATIEVVSQSATTLRVHVTPPAFDPWPPATPFRLFDGPSGDDIDETTSQDTVSAHWDPVTDFGSGVDYYNVSVSVRGTTIVPQTNIGATPSATFTGLSIPAGSTYVFKVQAVDRKGNKGVWTLSDGVTVTSSQPGPFTIQSNTNQPYAPDCVYIGSEYSHDSLFGNNASIVKTDWCDSPDTELTAGYIYAIGTSAGGTDILPYTSVGLTTYAVRTGLPLVVGQDYFVSVRAVDADGNAGPAQTSAAYRVDLTDPPAPASVSDGLGVDEDTSAAENRWLAHWDLVTDSPRVIYYYAIGTTPGGVDILSPTGTTMTFVELTNIPLPAGRYYTTVWARDGAGNISLPATSDGLTIDPGYDTVPPQVTITTPTESTNVFGVITLEANATDNIAIESVQFALDGQLVATPITHSPFILVWNSGTVPNGQHLLTAVARDSVHQTTSATVTINVDNATVIPTDPPPVVLLAPESDSLVSGVVTLQGLSPSGRTATFMIDGVELIPRSSYVTFFQKDWDSTTVANGTHIIQAVAYDQYGNRGVSYQTYVTVVNQSGIDGGPPATVTNLQTR